jgi:hypothetical protein
MGNVLSDEYWGSRIPRLINYGRNGRLNIRSVKIFTDGEFDHYDFKFTYIRLIVVLLYVGALGSWGAALLKPYSDNPETSGIMRSTPDALSKLVKQFWKDGWQVVRHALYCVLPTVWVRLKSV